MLGFAHVAGHSFVEVGLSPDAVVIDLGVNHGYFSSGIILRYGCKVFGAEPDPRPYADARRMLGDRVLQSAMSKRSGTAAFHMADYDQCSSLFSTEWKQVGTIDVRTITLDEFMNHFALKKVDLIKMDIEGAEYDVLRSMDANLSERIKQICVEFHGNHGMSADDSFRVCQGHLARLGFMMLDFSWETPLHDVLFVNTRLQPVGGVKSRLLHPVCRVLSGIYRSLRFSATWMRS